MEKVKKQSVLFFVFCILYFVFITCSDQSSGNNKVTFSGTVTLEGETDFSGVTVSLYELVELDTALVRINQQYPNIGVQISQETEFDHREHQPVNSTTTNSNGSWQVKVEEGAYNIVVEKEGFGWRYIFDGNKGNYIIELFQTIELSSTYFSNFIFEEGHTYIANSDVTFEAGVSIEQSNVLAGNNVSFTFKNSVENNDYSGFASFSNLNDDENWGGLLIESENNTLKKIMLKNAFNAIRVKAPNNRVTDTYISNSYSRGVIISNQITDCSIENFLIKNQKVGIELANIDSSNRLSKIIVCYSNEEGAYLSAASVKIDNAIFYSNDIGISTLFASNAKINNSLFENTERFGIEVASSNPEIIRNQFIGNSRVYIKIAIRAYAGAANPIAHYNNFINGDLQFFIYGTGPNPNAFDIDATNNWWGRTNTFEIQTLIFDKNDLPPTDMGKDYTGEIIWDPNLQFFNNNAGINK